ncbi:MAG TPA: hypothetical protein ENN97_10630 [Phycisphaerales bacterium]|nr:hypothetical protein [Phycisphaerales bacterium]
MTIQTTAKRFVKSVYHAWKWLLWGLRWLAVAVFTILFLAGLFFSLPWKILACLAVVPFVGIFVPRRVQPWCWAAMTAVVIGLAVWVHLPQQDAARWRTYRFDTDFARLLQQRRIEGAPNAAILYSRVLSEYDDDIFEPRPFRDEVAGQTLAVPWSAAEFPEVAGWLSVFEPAFDVLAEAAAMDQCRFPVASDVLDVRTQLRRLNQLKGWRNLLIRSANRDLQADRHDEALDKMLTVVGIARHLYQQQTLFDQAAAFSVEVGAARALRRYILDYAKDPNDLNTALAAMERLEPNWPDIWEGVVEHEKLIAKNIAALLYEIDENGRTRIHRSAIVSLGQGLGYPVPAGLHQDIVGRTSTLILWLSIPFSPDSAARLIERRFDRFSDLARRGTPAPVLPVQHAWRFGLNPGGAVDWLARQQMSYYIALNGQYKRHIALSRITALSAELRRFFLQHNRWPAHLSQVESKLASETLFDPVGEAAFAYRLTEEGFMLYSIGANAVDDAGRYDPQNNFDDIVFWPLDMLEPEHEEQEQPLITGQSKSKTD